MFEDAKILMVDDILTNLQLLTNIFSETNAKISFAMNGKQAVDQAEAFMPDLILLDISMPEMDGMTACELIKKNPNTKDIPIIFLTARVDTQEIVRGLSLGAADYISKPFKATELLARVKTHIELSQTRKRLQQSNLELSNLLKIRDRIISIISHDLRGPIGNLNQLLELIPNGSIEMEALELVEMCRTSAADSFYLLENLLNWAKKQFKEAHILKKDIDLFQLVVNNVKFQYSSIMKKNIGVNVNLLPSVSVFCDYNMLEVIIRNLLSNAIKFTPTDGLIEFNAIQKSKTLELRIADSGVGITTEQINKILDSNDYFTTLGTDLEKGTGLGLMICKEFIEANNGTLKIESTPEKGSCFIIELPSNL